MKKQFFLNIAIVLFATLLLNFLYGPKVYANQILELKKFGLKINLPSECRAKRIKKQNSDLRYIITASSSKNQLYLYASDLSSYPNLDDFKNMAEKSLTKNIGNEKSAKVIDLSGGTRAISAYYIKSKHKYPHRWVLYSVTGNRGMVLECYQKSKSIDPITKKVWGGLVFNRMKLKDITYKDNLYNFSLTLPESWTSIDVPRPKNSKDPSQKRFFFISPDQKTAVKVWTVKGIKSLKKFNRVFLEDIHNNAKAGNTTDGPDMLGENSTVIDFVTKEKKHIKLWSFCLYTKKDKIKTRAAYAVEFISENPIEKSKLRLFQSSLEFDPSVNTISGFYSLFNFITMLVIGFLVAIGKFIAKYFLIFSGLGFLCALGFLIYKSVTLPIFVKSAFRVSKFFRNLIIGLFILIIVGCGVIFNCLLAYISIFWSILISLAIFWSVLLLISVLIQRHLKNKVHNYTKARHDKLTKADVYNFFQEDLFIDLNKAEFKDLCNILNYDEAEKDLTDIFTKIPDLSDAFNLSAVSDSSSNLSDLKNGISIDEDKPVRSYGGRSSGRSVSGSRPSGGRSSDVSSFVEKPSGGGVAGVSSHSGGSTDDGSFLDFLSPITRIFKTIFSGIGALLVGLFDD